jgi:hypothetical protein
MIQTRITNAHSSLSIKSQFCGGVIILVLLSFLKFDTVFAQSSILIKNVSLITMTSNETLKDRDLLIENGKIKKIGKGIASSPNYLVIDGRGKFLMPGLIDMHVHIPNYKDKQMPVNHFLMLYLASGVTTIRSMRGDFDHLILRDSVTKGFVLSPHLVLSAPPFSARNIITDSIPSLIKRYKSKKFDFIKVLSVTSELQYNKIADEAKISLKAVTDEATPLIEEVHTTVTLVNGPLQSFNRITKNVEEISEKVTSATSSLLDKSGPALKVAGALVTAAQMGKGRAKKKKKKAE